MRARISTAGLKLGCRVTSRTFSPLIHTSRPSRSDSRYCSPVLIIFILSIVRHAREGTVAIDQRFGFTLSRRDHPSDEDPVSPSIIGLLHFAFENGGGMSQHRQAGAALIPTLVTEVIGLARRWAAGESLG